MATWNREEQGIVSDYQNGKISERAAECARRNEQGFKHNWTVEQHEAALIAKAISLIAASTPAAKSPSGQNRGTYNTGCGFYGTAKDAARGFDGIE